MADISFEDLANLAFELSDVTPFSSARSLDDILDTICQHPSIQLCTLWKIKRRSNHISAIARSGYDPKPDEKPTEYICPIDGTHVEKFINSEEFLSGGVLEIPNIRKHGPDKFFNTVDIIDELRLNSAWMISTALATER